MSADPVIAIVVFIALGAAFVLSLRQCLRQRRREREQTDQMLRTGMRSAWRRGLITDQDQ